MEQTKLTGYPSVDKPWLKYYTEEAINAPLPECTIYEYLVENNRAYPKDIAIHYLGRRITYGELFKRIDETAAAFAALGVAPGEIVTVALPSIPEALYCVYALNKIGAVANMIHPLAGTDELIHYLNEVESRIAILFDGTYKLIEKRIGETKLKHAIVVSAGESLLFGLKQFYYANNPKVWLPQDSVFRSWAWFQKGGKGTTVPAYAKNPDTLALISHTGGTTGEPKGVMCSDRSCNALMWQLLCAFTYKRQECSLNVLPPFINYSLLESILAMLAVGFIVVLIPKYEPMSFGKYIKRYRPNQVLSIPAYWEALLSIDGIEKIDMTCFKNLYSGGEKVDAMVEAKINRLLKQCGANTQVYNCVGATEMMAGATIIYDCCYTVGSVGIPMVKVDCKIVNPGSDEELTYGCEGEICFSGKTMMSGYYKNAEATDEVIKTHRDGKKWFHTGDIGYIDKNGAVFVTGRIKRILMTKGKDGNISKIFPDRIEKVISQHPAVAVNCAIGVPDPERVHIPVAYIVPNEDRANCERIEKELRELCKAQLPEYMRPDRFLFVEELPRTARGKIDYRALEERAVKEA